MDHPDALGAALDVLLDRHLLGPGNDIFDHCARVEVFEVKDVLITVGVGDLEESVALVLAVHPLHDPLDHRLAGRLAAVAVLGQILRVQRQVRGDVLGEDVPRRLGVRPLDFDLHVEPARPQDGRVNHVLPVGGADDNYVLQRLHAVDLAEQLGHDRVLDVGTHPRAPGPEDGIHLVEEDDHRHAFGGLLPRALEDEADLTLGLADVLVEQLRALDVEEERPATAFAGLLLHLLGQRVRHGLRDQGLAAAGRAVQQHSLGWLQLVLGEQLLVQEGQLDSVADRLDLALQAADLGVVDLGDLFEDELLDLGFRDALVGEPGA